MSAISVPRVAGRRSPSRSSPGDRSGVSILLAVYDPPILALRAQLDAIAAQTSPDWECIVVDDCSRSVAVVELLDAWCSVGPDRTLVRRTVNGGIATATNDALDRATLDVVAICDHDDLIHPGAVQAVLDHFDAHPTHDVVYTDEQLIDADGAVVTEYRKPDYSPHRHLGHHYLAHLVAARRAAIGDLRVDAAFEPSQDYDFYLRVIEGVMAAGGEVGHIADILYSWRAIAGSSALAAGEKPEMIAAVERCVAAALVRRDIPATASTVIHRGEPTTSVRLVFDEPLAVDSDSLDILSIGEGATSTDVAEMIAASTARFVCLAPDGHPIDNTWAAPLIALARLDGVGVVGPFITRRVDGEPDTLLSVGRTVVPRLSDPQARGVPVDASGLWGAFFVTREVTAVAPYGLLVERSLVQDAGGLATDVGLDVAVAELCVRLATNGHATLVEPTAILPLDHDGPLLDDDPEAIPGQVPTGGRADEVSIVARRLPEIRRERFATTGLLSDDALEPSPYLTAHRAIVSGATDLVTSDVFDTVVTRPMARPSDLFVELGRRMHSAGALPDRVTPAIFAAGRRSAEGRARTAHSNARRAALRADGVADDVIDRDPVVMAPECTLREVWEQMPEDWGDASTDDAVQRELDLEAEMLRPIDAVIDVFRTARAHAVPVVLVSDIYLDADQLAEVLAGAGVDMSLVDEVVTSADHRLGKAHGLLGRVLDERSVDADRTLHIGDNEVADVATARELGATPIHVDLHSLNRHVPMPMVGLDAWSAAHGTDFGITAAIRATLVEAAALGRDPSFQYGAGVVGPALAGFVRWVATETELLGASAVHCMLREGATIADLIPIVVPDSAAAPTAIRLHVSRWVTMRAAVVDGTPEELLTALARRADLTVDHVARAFDVDATLVREVLGADQIPPSGLFEACEALSASDTTRSQIVASAADLRERVLTHLRATLVVDDGPIVVADVGWGGTIQQGLERILRSAGIDNHVVGLYFALSAAGEQRLGSGADMRSYLPNRYDDPIAARNSRAIAHHADTIERIMTPEIGTLIDISPEGEPITRPDGHDVLPPTLRSAQAAMRAVVTRLADRSSGVSDLDDDRWVDDLTLRAAFAESIADSVTAPTEFLARALGGWPHDDVAGSDHRSIATHELATAARYANVRDLDLIDPDGRNWAAGVAAVHNHTLAAQIAADRAGVSLAGLCPENENGFARLAAFAIGSDLAAVQVGRAPSTSSFGWSLLRISGPIDTIRSVRFDAGEHDSIVDVDHLSIAFGTDLAFDPEPTNVDDLMSPDLAWVMSHPIDSHHFAQRAGGHLLIPIDPDIGAHVRSVEVVVGFRSWVLERDDTLAVTPVVQRIGAQSRRVVGGVKRRLGR